MLFFKLLGELEISKLKTKCDLKQSGGTMSERSWRISRALADTQLRALTPTSRALALSSRALTLSSRALALTSRALALTSRALTLTLRALARKPHKRTARTHASYVKNTNANDV